MINSGELGLVKRVRSTLTFVIGGPTDIRLQVSPNKRPGVACVYVWCACDVRSH